MKPHARKPASRAARARADAVLHPLRIRVVEAIAAARSPMTAAALREVLPDVAPATLYRHLAVLERAGVLAVVGEEQKRGAIERTYALPEGAAHLDGAAARALSRADHLRGFAAFTGHLLDSFGRYLAGRSVDLERDGVGYRSRIVHLDDAELAEMTAALGAALRPHLDKPPAPGRRARLLSTVLFPFV